MEESFEDKLSSDSVDIDPESILWMCDKTLAKLEKFNDQLLLIKSRYSDTKQIEELINRNLKLIDEYKRIKKDTGRIFEYDCKKCGDVYSCKEKCKTCNKIICGKCCISTLRVEGESSESENFREIIFVCPDCLFEK